MAHMRKGFTDIVPPLVTKDIRVGRKKNIPKKPKHSFGFKNIVITLSFLALVIGLFAKNARDRAYAELKIFTPTECYGDGTNLKNGTGPFNAPELDDDSFGYTKGNSASITGTFSEVVCGGFKGEIPKNIPGSKMLLKFSWGIGSRSSVTLPTKAVPTSAPLDVTPEKEVTSLQTSSEISSLTTGDTQGEEVSELQIQETIQADIEEEDETVVTDLDEPTPETTPTPKEEPTPEVKEEPKPETKPESSESISFFQKLFYSVVYAQESVQSDLEEEDETVVADLDEPEEEIGENEGIESNPESEPTPEPTSQSPEPTETLQADIDTINETIVVPVANINLELPEDNKTVEIATISQKTTTDSLQSDLEDEDETIVADLDSVSESYTTIDATPEPIIEILYTLDGESWMSLGTVTEANHGDYFELPNSIFSPEVDISKIQIAIQTLPSFKETSQLYLDALWLEVQEPEEIRIPTLPPEQLSARNFEKEIIVQADADHSCRAENFHIDISGTRQAQARIILSEDNIQADLDDSSIITAVIEDLMVSGQQSSSDIYQVEIGSLPLGIDVRFIANNRYIYQPEQHETVLDLDIKAQKNAPKGDFTVPIIYTHKGETESSVICQINIQNQ